MIESKQRGKMWILGLLILLLASAKIQAAEFGLFEYEVVNGEIEIIDYPEDATGYVIVPAEIEGLPVTRIGTSSFFECSEITGVRLPDSLESIGASAFALCTSLIEIEIPANVTLIEGAAFRDCYDLKSVLLPENITEIRTIVFKSCVELEEISISRSVESIAVNAFKSCYKLDTVNFPADSELEVIEQHAFINCKALTNLDLPANLTTIGFEAFYGCEELISCEFQTPSKLKTLEASAFRFCRSLESITLPSSLEELGNNAFWDCESLSQVTFMGDSPNIGGPVGGRGRFPFLGTADDLVIFHAYGARGFGDEFWEDYTTQSIIEEVKIGDVSVSDGKLQVELVPAFVRGIGVEYSPDLSPGSWQELGNFFEIDGVWRFIDPDDSRASRPQGYYRAFQRTPTN